MTENNSSRFSGRLVYMLSLQSMYDVFLQFQDPSFSCTVNGGLAFMPHFHELTLP